VIYRPQVMEGFPEKMWRRDAIWAIVVIVAAISFGIEAVSRLAGQCGQSPGTGSFDLQYLQRLARIATIVFSAGTILFLAYLAAFVSGVRLFPVPERRPAAWNIWDVAKAAATAYLVMGIVNGIVTALLGLAAGPHTAGLDEAYIIVAQAVVLHLAILALAIGFVMARHGDTRAMGFTGRGWHVGLLHGVLGYAAILPAFYATIALSVWLMSLFSIGPTPNPIIPALRQAGTGWFTWVAVFVITIFGPFTEEVFFRGYLYPAMRRRLSVWPAILINGFLFSIIHVSITDFLPILLLGVALAFLFEKTRSLVSCTAFHVLNNSLQMAIFFLMDR